MARRALVLLLVAAAVLAVAAPRADAHAFLVRTTPSASGTLDGPPSQVFLQYSEPVEPRFAIVSVTDAGGRQVVDGSPRHADGGADALEVPVRRLAAGWYLVFWRVISADGHPVRGAFTFAVGPNAGPAPEFAIPSLSETAATPSLVVARWVVFLALMTAVGLFAFRVLIARPAARAGPAASLRPISVVFGIALAVALVATPVYTLLSTAQFALRSTWDLGDLVPVARASLFGRGFLDLELVVALFALAAGVALLLDRPDRPLRSEEEVLSLLGAGVAAGAALFVPGLAGHPAQASHVRLALALDWAHLLAGSVWLGGLVGLLVLAARTPRGRRVAVLSEVVPRFSNVALGAVMLLVATGTGAALLHVPTLASLWETGYGQAILAKVALLLVAMLLAGVNLVRTRPRLAAAGRHPERGPAAASLLRRLVGAEVGLVAATILAAALLTSLAPPSPALAQVGRAAAQVGPGPVRSTVAAGGYRLELSVTPNRAAVDNRFSVRVTRGGRPVTGAAVTIRLTMLDMDMADSTYRLAEGPAGTYTRTTPALVMVGHWGLHVGVEAPGAAAVEVFVRDRAEG